METKGNFMTLQEQFTKKYAELVQIANQMDVGDPFGAGRAREIILSGILGHKIGSDLHGIDAESFCGKETYEYKTSLSTKYLTPRYDVSWCDTWENQIEYLKQNKIANHEFHFFASFTILGEVTAIYKMSGDKVLELLLPKLQRKFYAPKKRSGVLYASLSEKDLREHAELIYGPRYVVCKGEDGWDQSGTWEVVDKQTDDVVSVHSWNWREDALKEVDELNSALENKGLTFS